MVFLTFYVFFLDKTHIKPH